MAAPVLRGRCFPNQQNIGLSLLFHCSSEFGGLFTNIGHRFFTRFRWRWFCLNQPAWRKRDGSKRAACPRTPTRATVTRAVPPVMVFLVAKAFHGGKLTPGDASPPFLDLFRLMLKSCAPVRTFETRFHFQNPHAQRMARST